VPIILAIILAIVLNGLTKKRRNHTTTSMSTSMNLLNTVGPFLLFSNTWSAFKMYRGGGRNTALQTFLTRAVRFLSVVVGLRLTSRLTTGRSKLLQQLTIFASGSMLHHVCQPYHWTLSLYFTLRSTGLLLSNNKRPTDRSWPVALLRHPSCIFVLHCVHNYFVTHHADKVSPSYLKLWRQVLPIQYNKVDKWLNEFNATSCATPYYQPEQCGTHRVNNIPHRVTVSLRRQLPLVATSFLLPVLLFKRKALLRSPIALMWDTAIKIVRSSVVLTALPFLVTEFPCLWGMFTNQPPEKTIRRPVLHTVVVSMLSTGVFLLEPVNRLRLIVVYTYWRASEVVMMHAIPGLSTEKNESIEQTVGMVLSGFTAVLTSTT